MTSSSSTDQDRSRIGRLGRPHGLDGFLGFYIDDVNLALVQPGATVYLGDVPHTVRAIRRADRGHQVAFEEASNRPAAEKIRGFEVFAASPRDLEFDEFWERDLIGLTVTTEGGDSVGKVADVIIGGSQDRLVVEGTNGVFEVPFVVALVPEVDIESGFIRIKDLPGLTGDSSS